MIERPRGAVEPLPLAIVRPGQTPVRQGEPSAALWRVDAGLLRANLVRGDGRDLTVDLLGPGELVGEPPGATSAWTVLALRPSRLVAVDIEAAAGLLAERARRLTTVAHQLAFDDVPTRIEGRLHDLAMRFGRPGPGGTSVPITLSQEALASLAGTTRETANRAIRKLIRDGAVVAERRGRYVVCTLRVVPG
ncbi:MAG: Crp/Fnr family transcriptional regulator [Actinomycetota bacterium]